MGWDTDPGMEYEALLDERFEADMQQAQFEAEGNALYARTQRMERLRDAGRLDEAAATCPHGGGYPLDSPAAEHSNDPNAGETGYRCSDCGSRLSESPLFGGDRATVTAPCEFTR